MKVLLLLALFLVAFATIEPPAEEPNQPPIAPPPGETPGEMPPKPELFLKFKGMMELIFGEEKKESEDEKGRKLRGKVPPKDKNPPMNDEDDEKKPPKDKDGKKDKDDKSQKLPLPSKKVPFYGVIFAHEVAVGSKFVLKSKIPLPKEVPPKEPQETPPVEPTPEVPPPEEDTLEVEEPEKPKPLDIPFEVEGKIQQIGGPIIVEVYSVMFKGMLSKAKGKIIVKKTEMPNMDGDIQLLLNNNKLKGMKFKNVPLFPNDILPPNEEPPNPPPAEEIEETEVEEMIEP